MLHVTCLSSGRFDAWLATEGEELRDLRRRIGHPRERTWSREAALGHPGAQTAVGRR